MLGLAGSAGSSSLRAQVPTEAGDFEIQVQSTLGEHPAAFGGRVHLPGPLNARPAAMGA